jgi:hypothetical protein
LSSRKYDKVIFHLAIWVHMFNGVMHDHLKHLRSISSLYKSNSFLLCNRIQCLWAVGSVWASMQSRAWDSMFRIEIATNQSSDARGIQWLCATSVQLGCYQMMHFYCTQKSIKKYSPKSYLQEKKSYKRNTISKENLMQCIAP